MSRFYAALKEASRLNPSPNGNGEGLIPEPRSTDAGGTTAPPDHSISTVSVETAMEEVVAMLGQETPRNGTSPTAVKALLDRTARLIPHAADPTIVEHYRRLRTKLLHQYQLQPFRLLMIASPNPQEGKTVTTLNLALSFAMIPACKVLVIDGDLRKGSLGKWMAVDGQPGLSNLIDGTAEIQDIVLKSDDIPMHFVLRGNSKASAAELLNSPRLNEYFRSLAEQFDVVLVDSPPLNLITDAQLLAHCCDGVLLVARAFSTTKKALEKAVQDLQPFRVLGAVLNGATRMKRYRKYSSYY